MGSHKKRRGGGSRKKKHAHKPSAPTDTHMQKQEDVELPLHELFHLQAARTPKLIAVVGETGSLTYEELNHRVLALAEYLRQRGVGPEKTVGMYLPPSLENLVAMLAIMSAGGAYIPIELAYPSSLISKVCADAKPVIVLTTSKLASKLDGVVETLNIDNGTLLGRIQRRGIDFSVEELEKRRLAAPKVSLDNLAFIVYSSGTTGEPKGIANPHRAPVLSYNWRFKINDYGPGDRVGCNTFFVWEAVRPVLKGATTYCIDPDVIFDSAALLSYLQDNQITEILMTPTLFNNLLVTEALNDVRSKMEAVKTILLNGEVVSTGLARTALTCLPKTSIYNLYSISECHEVAMTDLREYDLNASQFCAVGRPSELSHALVLGCDDAKQVEQGEVGELYIVGPLLARCYLNQTEMTDERFPPCPYQNSFSHIEDRMYNTGDLARMLPNGMIEILGRSKFMVKIRGYTVVPAMVEAEIKKAVAVSQCAVITHGDEGTEKHLVAFVVAEYDQSEESFKPKLGDDRLQQWSIDTRTGHCPQIRTALNDRLAHYMIPSRYVQLPKLPLHAIGKLDVKALNRMAQESSVRSFRKTILAADVFDDRAAYMGYLFPYLKMAKGTPSKAVLGGVMMIWDGVLNIPVGTTNPNSSFQELGGMSLSSARLITALRQTFGVKLGAAELLRGATPAMQAETIQALWEGVPAKPLEARQRKGSEMLIDTVRAAAKLSKSVTPSKDNANTTPIPASEWKNVLITGVTGYFGAHLLVEVLTRTKARVHCLVRGANGQERVTENLAKYELDKVPEVQDAIANNRVLVVSGQLDQRRFGLSDKKWMLLASEVDAVLHSAAAVKLGAQWDVLEGANVNGTLQIIKLCCAARPGVSLLHISTNGIFPWGKDAKTSYKENKDIDELPHQLDSTDGYGLTKWAAESLVHEANKRGLPAVVLRLGNLGWHSKTGHGNPFDFQCMLLRGVVRLGKSPRIPDGILEMTPVDYAATQAVGLLSPANCKAGKVFHLVQPTPVNWEKVMGWLDSLLDQTIQRVDFKEWEELVSLKSGEGKDEAALFAFLEGIGELPTYLSSQMHLNCDEFDKAASAPRPEMAESSLALFLGFEPKEQKQPVLPKSAIEATGPLRGKVAVVTGASSGIGRAIAVSLVEAGCDVVLAARREKALIETARACDDAQKGARVLCVATDVTVREQVIKLVNRAEREVGPVDIFVNNAGVMYFTLMKNVMWEQWDNTIKVNCQGTTNGIGAILPSMLKRGSGHIINITSDAGRKAFAGLAVYSGSKFYVEGLSQALRVETASTGLRVTCIQPGNVKTPLLSTSTDPEGLTEYGTPSGAKVLEPRDIGRAVVYAASQPEWVAVNEILVEPREEPA